MGAAEWFVIGGIVIAAVDEIINRSSLKENSTIHLVMSVLKRIFPKR